MTPRGKVKVLVVDDSVVVRRMVTDGLAEDPDIEVVGSASNGRIALNRMPQLAPDVITLDVEMPELDGLATLRELRKSYPRLPVIMFSTLTLRGGTATLDALAMGASDYVTKPSNVGSVGAAKEAIRQELIPKIKTLCGFRSKIDPPLVPLSGVRTLPPLQSRPRTSKVEIITIGVSTGGPNALAAVIPALPKDLPVPVVIVQHMPPVFTRLLAERLATLCNHPVMEASDGDRPRPGSIWIAPGGSHTILSRESGEVVLRLHHGPMENSCRPSVDVLFRSAAEVYGAGTLAVILTGMGKDGFDACRLVHSAGGQVLAQDEPTSVVWGMPGFVVRGGLADAVLPLSSVAPEIIARARRGRITPFRY